MTTLPEEPHRLDRRRPGGFVRAFLASAVGTGLARVLGAVRDVVIAGFLGASAASDAFWVAFLIPNVFRRFVADEGLTGAVVPAIARAEGMDGEEGGRILANRVFGVLLVANLGLCVIGVLAAEPLVLAFAYTWQDDPQKMELAVTMTRWLFPFVAMVSLVSFFEGLLNHRGHFFAPKVAPGLVSAGMAASAMLLGTSFEEPVYALVVGVLVGGLVHVLVNLPPVARRWGPLRPALVLSPRVRAVLWELGKVVVIGIFAQINIIVLRQLATSLPDGSVTYYHNGTRIVDLAQGIVAVAIGSALLPNLSDSVAAGSWDRFRHDLTSGLRLAMFLLVPVAAVVFVWAEPICALLFRHGSYTWSDVVVTAQAVQYFVPFLLALAAISIVKRVLHALDDRTTLIVIGAVGVVLTGGLGLLLVDRLGVPGLALALSVATVAQLVVYLVVLVARLGRNVGLSDLPGPLVQMTLATAPLVPLLLWLRGLGDWTRGPLAVENWLVIVLGGALAVAVYLGLAAVLGIHELQRLVGAAATRASRGTGP